MWGSNRWFTIPPSRKGQVFTSENYMTLRFSSGIMPWPLGLHAKKIPDPVNFTRNYYATLGFSLEIITRPCGFHPFFDEVKWSARGGDGQPSIWTPHYVGFNFLVLHTPPVLGGEVTTRNFPEGPRVTTRNFPEGPRVTNRNFPEGPRVTNRNFPEGRSSGGGMQDQKIESHIMPPLWKLLPAFFSTSANCHHIHWLFLKFIWAHDPVKK